MQSLISLGQLEHIMTCLGLKVYDLGDDYRLAQTLLLVIVQHDLVNFKHLVVLERPFAQWHRKSSLWFLFRHLSAPSSVFPVIQSSLHICSHPRISLTFTPSSRFISVSWLSSLCLCELAEWLLRKSGKYISSSRCPVSILGFFLCFIPSGFQQQTRGRRHSERPRGRAGFHESGQTQMN